MRQLLAVVGTVLLLNSWCVAADEPKTLTAGKWLMTYASGPVGEQPAMIIEVKGEGDKFTAEKIASPEKVPFEYVAIKADKAALKVKLVIGKRPLEFNGTLQADGKTYKGTFGDEALLNRGFLRKTELSEIDENFAANLPKPPASFTKAATLVNAPTQLRIRAQRSKDLDEKADLTKKATEAQEKATAEGPNAWREVIKEAADSPFAVVAATNLLNMASTAKADAKEVSSWIDLVDKDAATFGETIQDGANLQIATALSNSKEHAKLGVAALEKVLGKMKETDSLAKQSRTLRLAKKVYESAGLTEQLKKTTARFDAVEAKLDQEYVAKMPPFPTPKVKPSGEKNQRVQLLELFTGTQCPPCVAADLGFDGLIKSYEPTDVIFIQYHMHIPGPDPLTNPDSAARFAYYGKLNEGQVRGTPTSIINGVKFVPAGGGLDNASGSYANYKKQLEASSSDKSEIKIDATIGRSGDQLQVEIKTEGTKEDDKLTVRAVLTEENIHYVGSNTIRYHHHVARHFVGGVKGQEINSPKFSVKNEVNLTKVQEDLAKYQEEFIKKNGGSYFNPAPKMDASKLKLVVFVQNDKTGEVVNAKEFAVPAK